MRPCPVCGWVPREKVFSMTYQIPDGWPLPPQIDWYTCGRCGMIYGDGNFDQAMLNEFYTKYYGYGVSNPDNIERLKRDAEFIAKIHLNGAVVDFGGAGDDGRSVLVEKLSELPLLLENFVVIGDSLGHKEVHFCVGPNDAMPANCAVIYASHVLEHIYDLPETMQRLVDALAPDGLLIVDVPDSTGLLNRWKMPILDFNTKHVNHFTVRTLLELGHRYGLEAVQIKPYELEFAPCVQVHFRRLDVAQKSSLHIWESIFEKKRALSKIDYPVNIWGLGDVTWHVFADPDQHLDNYVLDYIDSDPAFEGQTFKGKPVLKRPTNDAPIVIMAQGQRARLIKYIRDMGIQNEIIEI